MTAGCDIISAERADVSVEERLQNLIENLSAYIEGQVAHVELGGACSGCLLSPNRLHGWIAGTIRQFFPDIMVEEAPPTG